MRRRPRVDAGGVVGGAVEQLGDVDRHVIVGRRQLALGQALEGGQRGLDARLRADDVAQHLFALFVRHVQGGEHFEVGAHRGQGVRSSCETRRRSRAQTRAHPWSGPARSRCAAACPHGLGDLDRLGGTAHRHLRPFVGVDRTGLLGQAFERPHRESRQEPSEHRRRADRQRTDQDHPAMQVVGLGDRVVVRRAHCHRRRLRRGDLKVRTR